MDLIYQIIRLKDIPEQEFIDNITSKLNEKITLMTGTFIQYDFTKHIFKLEDYLPMVYAYWKDSVIQVNNEIEIPDWEDQVVRRFIDTLPTLYTTSKFITEKLAERINADMGSRTGLNSSDFNITMQEIKFGLVSLNTNFIEAYSKVLDLAYPSFIINWLNSLRPLFITTLVGC